MKFELIMLIYLFYSIFSNTNYQISFDIFLSGEKKYDLDLFNQLENNINNKNIFYSGSIEDIEEILFNKNTYSDSDKKIYKNHPLVFISNKDYFIFIKYFSTKTKFIIPNEYADELENVYQDYTILILKENIYEFSFNVDYLSQEKRFYVKLGKKIDVTMNKNIYLFLFLNTIICLINSIILRKAIKKVEQENILPIHYLMCNFSELLFITNVINDLSFLIFKNIDYFFLSESMTLFLYSFYKSIFYTTIILILLGWSTITFFDGREKFQKINKRIFYYDLIFTIGILLSLYFIYFTTKLNLFHTKNISEHFFLLCFTIYSIFKKIIPLSKQMIYEQGIRSNLASCVRFKFIRLSLTSVVILAYTIFFLNTPFLDKKYIYCYVDNMSLHIIFQLFYENIFIIFFTIIFYPTELPNEYFDEIIFNYNNNAYLLVNVYEQEKDEKNKKLNISKLSFERLKKLSKKENYPIILINPFISSKDKSLFNEIHIGKVQTYLKLNLYE